MKNISPCSTYLTLINVLFKIYFVDLIKMSDEHHVDKSEINKKQQDKKSTTVIISTLLSQWDKSNNCLKQ